jgi:ATP-dependent DNA ligase
MASWSRWTAKGQAVFYELPSSLTAKPARVKGRLVYYAFDRLYLDGIDLRGAALIDRKRVLEALLDNTSGVHLIRYVDHIGGDGELALEHACKLGLEGAVSKLADAAYRWGRSTCWIKTECAAWKDANRDRFERLEKLGSA